MKTVLIICSLFVFLIACEDQKKEKFEEELVVNAYLFANSPVNWIYINKSVKFGSNIANEPVNNAKVSITWNKEVFLLENNPLIPGNYKYNFEDLKIIPGDEYVIDVVYEDKNVTGTTTVPYGPKNLVSSADTIKIDVQRNSPSNQVLFQWDNSDFDYSTVVIRPESENQNYIWDDKFTNSNAYWLSIPSLSNYRVFTDFDIKYYGTNVLVVYSANLEYVNMFNEFDQIDLFSKNTNLENGVGIFTAFSTDSVQFFVAPQK